MTTTTRTARLVSAVAAGATSLALFSAVIGIAEPQRGMLMAKTHAAERLASRAGATTVALASPAGTSAQR